MKSPARHDWQPKPPQKCAIVHGPAPQQNRLSFLGRHQGGIPNPGPEPVVACNHDAGRLGRRILSGSPVYEVVVCDGQPYQAGYERAESAGTVQAVPQLAVQAFALVVVQVYAVYGCICLVPKVFRPTTKSMVAKLQS